MQPCFAQYPKSLAFAEARAYVARLHEAGHFDIGMGHVGCSASPRFLDCWAFNIFMGHVQGAKRFRVARGSRVFRISSSCKKIVQEVGHSVVQG